MVKKKEAVAMLLAGGQGSRLYLLTEGLAKPAVPFGGKYRIIDFPLSNCINSGIDTVGVLTQYQPLALNEYIGNGQPWDLDRTYGGVMMLPPYQASKRADWYKGTANAIYQNMHFIKKYKPEYVVILSGDHIYKMDYRSMIDFHKKVEADCTIAVFDVPLSEASRFGIMNTNEDMSVNEFEEKPKVPKSTKASMGVYVFNTEKLFEYLSADEADGNSEKDFGKNIIPAMLNAGEKLFAYKFDGYWKDVGTISSLWEANMDLLGDRPKLSLKDGSWRIYSRNYAEPPHFVGNSAVISNSLITEGCEIYGTVINSVLSGGVTIEPNAVVRDSVLLNEVIIKSGAEVNYSVIDRETVVGIKAKVGKIKQVSDGITLVGAELIIKDGTVIPDNINVSSQYLQELEGGN
ncbi:MAG: glucose-1-phosphate adenylyltransferase [Clostridiales bacterium GWF2_36_10]|nr:MAG: glucose-1-phosphate adenylyltransferase [Clostridiales bacterium GWF2_36_10]HAN20533.1 glucose-1-phosphate adenylyltransferase [Clostridiales bacterium]